MPAPSDAKYIVSASHAELDNEIVIPGLAEHADMPGLGGAGTSEEYDTSTTGLTWSTAPDIEDSNTTRISHLYVQDNGASETLGLKSWSPGSGAFDVRCKMAMGTESTSGNPSFGLIVTSSGDTNRALIQLECVASGTRFEIGSHTYTGGAYTQRGHTTYIYPYNVIYLRITRDGSNNFNWFFSQDGYGWVSNQSAVFNFSFTVANVGFRMNAASMITSAYVDWLRTDI